MRISDWSSDVCSSDLGAWDSAQALLRARWPWAQPVLERLKKPNKPERWLFSRLPEWEEGAPRPPARTVALSEADVAERLADLTGAGAEQRPGQRAYAQAAAMAFAPRREAGRPNMVLRSGEDKSELQSLMRIPYAVYRLKKK